MDEIFEAALLFWLPFAFIPLGFWISQLKSSKLFNNFGYSLIIVGLIFVLSSPWTVPESPSSAVGQLLGFIAGPTILVLHGLYKIAYSGNVPVGKLTKRDKNLGFVSLFVGITWLNLMHWWGITPSMDNSVNRYWLVFLPNLLLSLSCFCLAIGIGLLAFGDSRARESRYLFAMASASFIFLLCAMNLDSINLTAIEFREYVWLSVADLLGIFIGAVLAIMSFASVIFVYEKNLPKPVSIEPPTSDELAVVSRVIKNNLGDENS